MYSSAHKPHIFDQLTVVCRLVCIRYYVLPENVEASLPELQAIATQYSAVTKEIWATEYGWSTNNERARYSVAKYVVVPTLHERTRSGNTCDAPGTWYARLWPRVCTV
jgi:hypothetical protein